MVAALSRPRKPRWVEESKSHNLQGREYFGLELSSGKHHRFVVSGGIWNSNTWDLKFNQNFLQEKTLTVSTLPSHYRSDDSECKSQIIRVADMLIAVSTKNLQVVAAMSVASCGKWQNPGVTVATQTVPCLSKHEMKTDCGEKSQERTR
jgi:hypothetical protein